MFYHDAKIEINYRFKIPDFFHVIYPEPLLTPEKSSFNSILTHKESKIRAYESSINKF